MCAPVPQGGTVLVPPGLAAPCEQGGGPEPRERHTPSLWLGVQSSTVRFQAQLTLLVMLRSPVSLQSHFYFLYHKKFRGPAQQVSVWLLILSSDALVVLNPALSIAQAPVL